VKQFIVYSIFLIALVLCFYFGKLLMPNKNKALKISGYLSLLFTGPFIYIFSCMLVGSSINLFVNVDTIKAEYMYAFFTICILLSPLAIGLGVSSNGNGR
jgi:hypothetical protein